MQNNYPEVLLLRPPSAQAEESQPIKHNVIKFCILSQLHQLAARSTEDGLTAKAISHLPLGLKNDFMDN